jgi:TP901 family phage tail tape measure protein
MDGTSNTIQTKVIIDTSQAQNEVQKLKEEIEKLKQRSNVRDKGISDELQKELASAKNIVNEKGKEINSVLNGIGSDSTGINKFVDSYRKAITTATADAEKFHRLFAETGSVQYQNRSIESATQVRQLTADYENFNRTLGLGAKQAGLLDGWLTKLKSHAAFFISGAVLGAAIAIPTETVKTLADLETEFNTLQTVIPSMHESQAGYNRVVEESFRTAKKYATEIGSVTDALRLWGRGYKDLGEAMQLTNISTALAVADNFSPEVANKAIESIISSFGKQKESVQFATHAMDAITSVSHNAQVSANDLAEAHMRSASAAHAVGVQFDELNAMIGVISRNTSLGGATVGQGIKSILNSIHSKKAIEELEKLNISIYKTGENGEKQFRKISDVLLDVAIKVPAVKTNMEEAFRDLGSGKFQVNKVSALLGDPNEYIRLLGQSINSAGFTQKQLVLQLDTIKRKAETVKTSLEQLVMTGGQAGASAYIKSWLDDINQFLKGLNEIPQGVYSTIGTFTKWATVIYAVKTALTFIETNLLTLTTITAANTVTTTANAAAITAEGAAAGRTAVAMETLGVATKAAGGIFGILTGILVAGGTALAVWAMSAGETAQKLEEQSQQTTDLITAKQSELEMTKQQIDHLETLGNAYTQLRNELVAVQGDEEKTAQIKQIMGTVEKELAQITGQAAADRILASDDIQGAIAQEQKVHEEKANQIQGNLSELVKAQRKLAQDTVDMANERIGAINQEAVAFDKAADSIGEALGRIDEIMFKYYRNKANYLNGLAEGGIKDEWKIAGIQVPEGQDISAVTNQIKSEADAATIEAEKLKNNAIGYYATKGKAALADFYKPGSYTATKIGGDDVPPADHSGRQNKGRKEGTGAKNPPADHTQEVFRLDVGRDTEHLFKQAKITADQYSQSLELLNAKESLFGFSTETASTKLELMNKRILELIGQSWEYNEIAQGYDQQVNDMIASNSTLVQALDAQKIAWSDLTKEEKQAFIQANRNSIEQEKTITKLITLSDQLKVKAQEASKDASHIGIETAKTKKESPQTEYNKDMQNLDLSKQHATYQLGRKATTKQKNEVDLQYSVLELARAEQRLKEIENSPTHTTEELKSQQVAVDKLKQKVQELSDVWATQKEQAFDVLDSILIKGNSWKDELKKMWQSLASDALHLLITKKPSADGGGLLGGLLTNLFGHADGGIFDEEHVARFAEGNKAEAVIPLEDNKERGKQIWYESGKRLGTLNDLQPKNTGANIATSLAYKPPKVEYVPYLKNANVVNQFVQQKSQVAQQHNQLNRLGEVVDLLYQQNQILVQRLNGNSGNSNVAIVNSAVSAEQIGEVLKNNPEMLQNIMGKQRNGGWR